MNKLFTRKDRSIINTFLSNKNKLDKELIEYLFHQYVIKKVDKNSLLNKDYKCQTMDYKVHSSTDHKINIEMKYKSEIVTFNFNKTKSTHDIKILLNKIVVYKEHKAPDAKDSTSSDSNNDSDDDEDEICDKDDTTALMNFLKKVRSIF